MGGRGGLLLVFLVAAVAWVAVAMSRQASLPAEPPPLERGALPCYGVAADVGVVTADGRGMRTHELGGSVCLLGLIFTHCETVCPLLTQTLCRLGRRCEEARSAELGAGAMAPCGGHLPWLRIVSVTVDPWRDDPPRLATYAREQGAEGTLFLTGEPAALLAFMKSIFLVSQRVTRLEPETHSAGIVLLDPYRRVRGLYFRRTPAEQERIVGEVGRLARELGWSGKR